MICQSCGNANPAGVKFCEECGSRLGLTCVACGAPLSPTAKFCGECGTPAPGSGPTVAAVAPTTTTSEPVAERRLVTVLFADLVGFTTFAEGRDAEDVRETLSRYFEVSSDVITRYGGTVEKFIGDAVMAVWGAPTAHEDDAERAVRAGLELVDAVHSLGPGIQARAGVLTGQAAVTIGATNQGMVAGDLVNTAARLQSVAPPGSVLVGEATQRASAGAIAFEPAGDQLLKGKSAPVPAFHALRVVAERGGRNRSEVLEAPFVGRDEELRLLKDLFHSTGRENRTRLVSVVGPGGIGKSRLSWEFLKYVDGLVENVWWHDGRSPAYGDGITFWALGEMVRGRAGLLETDDAATTRAKVADMAGTHVPDPEERRWIESALLTLLGVESGLAAGELFGAWRTFFERLTATAPVVMVFEDLHFADAGLLDFIDHLLDWSKGYPIHIVTLARPELLDRRPEWGSGKRNFVSLGLEPLPEPAMRELLAGLVPGLPDSAVGVIVDRAAGFPLYAVETVRMLVAEGRLKEEAGVYRPVGDLTDLAVPETLIALIGSRLDALPPEARSLLQAAAVLGQSFTFDGLSSVASIAPGAIEEHLRTLVRRELLTLEIDPRSPERGQHSFVQALIREVAYSTLSKKDRKARHLAAARFFEGLGSDELAGALAGHYLAAYRNASEGPEADALAGQARIALRAAGQRAFDLGSMQQAVGFYDQAREITDDEAEAADLLERAGMAAFEGGRDELSETRLKDALELRRRTDDPGAVARATALLGRVLTTHLRPEAAIALLEPAVRDLEPSGEPLDEPTVQILAELSRAYYFNEEHVRAIELADRALAAGERLDLVAIVSELLVNRGTALLNLGRSYEGAGAIQAGLELAEQNGLTTTVLRAQVNLGISHAAADPRKGLEMARAALAAATRLGRRSFARTLMMNVGSAALDVGDWERAAQELESFRDEEADEAGAKFARWSLVPFAALTGEDVEAEVEDLAAWAATIGEDGADVATHGLRADVAFARGRFREAIDGWMANGRGDALNAPSVYYHAGLAALLLGDRASAAEALAALEGTGAHGSFVAANRRLIAGGISALDGQQAEALTEFRAALGAYRDLGVEWRFALGVVVISTVIGTGESDIREAADEARAILVRLGAKPALALLDAAMAAEPSGKAPAEAGLRTATPAG